MRSTGSVSSRQQRSRTPTWGSSGGGEAVPGGVTVRLRVVAPAPAEMLTVREVAAALRVNTATVYKLFPCSRPSRRKVNHFAVNRVVGPSRVGVLL